MLFNKYYRNPSKAQSAVEYLLLLAVVASIILISLKTRLPKIYPSAELYFNKTSVGIAGKPNPCGDGNCVLPFENCQKCSYDCPFGCP